MQDDKINFKLHTTVIMPAPIRQNTAKDMHKFFQFIRCEFYFIKKTDIEY